ncbi:hypothetical protein ACJX0J_021425, partial [Zea mays]
MKAKGQVLLDNDSTCYIFCGNVDLAFNIRKLVVVAASVVALCFISFHSKIHTLHDDLYLENGPIVLTIITHTKVNDLYLLLKRKRRQAIPKEISSEQSINANALDQPKMHSKQNKCDGLGLQDGVEQVGRVSNKNLNVRTGTTAYVIPN